MVYLIIILFISILISVYVIAPLVRTYYAGETKETYFALDEGKGAGDYSNLIKQRDLIINELRDIEFDYGLGKLNKSDYTDIRNKYRYKAAEIIKQIEEYGIENRNTENIEAEILKVKKTLLEKSSS